MILHELVKFFDDVGNIKADFGRIADALERAFPPVAGETPEGLTDKPDEVVDIMGKPVPSDWRTLRGL